MKKKILVLVLVSLIVLAGCRKRDTAPMPVSSSQSSESVQPPESEASSEAQSEEKSSMDTESEPFTLVLGSTAHEVAEEFTRALLASDIPTLESIVLFPDLVREYWTGVKVGSAAFTVMEEVAYSGLYEVTLDILDPGKTTLKPGTGAYILNVGIEYDRAQVRSLTPVDKYIDPEKLVEDRAVQQVVFLRTWGTAQSFAQVSDLDRDRLLEVLIILASYDFAVYGEGQIYELTQEQIDMTAKKYYGMDSFAYTGSKFYNASTQRYELWGRGTGLLNEKVVSVREDPATGEKAVTVEAYADALQAAVTETLVYTLRPNADGSYCFVSALAP